MIKAYAKDRPTKGTIREVEDCMKGQQRPNLDLDCDGNLV
jgi:hypothetical protein